MRELRRKYSDENNLKNSLVSKTAETKNWVFPTEVGKLEFISGNLKVGICQRKPEKWKLEGWNLPTEVGKLEFASENLKIGI